MISLVWLLVGGTILTVGDIIVTLSFASWFYFKETLSDPAVRNPLCFYGHLLA